ncbi:MAG: hypothetical protein NTW26_04345 [bacterium]|nr:hypothetical protein [bacterium]
MTGRDDAALRRLDEIYRSCALCPRACGVDRTAGEHGGLNRRPTPAELEDVREYARGLGLHRGF